MRRRPRPLAAWSPSLQKRNHHTHIYQFSFKMVNLYILLRVSIADFILQGVTKVKRMSDIFNILHIRDMFIFGTTVLNPCWGPQI